MSATADRDRISSLAKSDFDRAFSEAREIDDHWFAAQALAWVLRFAPDSSISSVAKELRRRAASCKDEYQRSAVTAWKVRALAERGYLDDAEAELSKAIAIARQAMPPSSRSEALFLLFQAAYPLGQKGAGEVAGLLVETWLSAKHWRCERALVSSLAMLSALDARKTEVLKERCAEPRISAKIEREIQNGRTQPRPFFW